MSHITKAFKRSRYNLYGLSAVFLSVLALSLMGLGLSTPTVSALSLTDITNNVNNLVTMGKDQPDPIYVPAQSNAPGAANAAPTATTPESVLQAEAIAASGTAQSGNTSLSTSTTKTNASSPAGSAQGKIVQSKNSVYTIAELNAGQHRLVAHVTRFGLLVGGIMVVIGLAAYSLQKLANYKAERIQPSSRRSEVKS